MSAPTVSSIEADKEFDKAMGFGCATSGGRGVSGWKTQLTFKQRQQLKINQKKNAEKEAQQKKNNTNEYLLLKQKSEAGLLAEF